MTSHNENDSSPIKTASDISSSPEAGKGEGREGGQRRPRRQGAGASKHPFNKKRPFNKDRPRREGGESGGQREGQRREGRLGDRAVRVAHLEDGSGHIVVETTRPETFFGDTAVAVVATTCPICQAQGTLIVAFGPMASPEDLDVLAAIRAEMARRGIPQAAVAKALGISQQSFSRRLCGVTPLYEDEIIAIADVIGCRPNDLLRPGSRR